MKAISLHQPWASLIREGLKTIETRSWSSPYRGPIAVHAAKKWDKQLRELCQIWPFNDALPTSDPDALPRACIIALATLTDCRQVTPFLAAQIRDRLNEAYGEARFSEYMTWDAPAELSEVTA